MSKLPKSIKVYKNEEEFESNLPETVKLLKTKEGSKVFVVGCSHFSRKSQDDVSLVIRNVKPDVVVLELCHLRVDILNEKNLSRELSKETVAQVLKKHGPITGGFYLYLSRMSTTITKELGEAPGGECRRAIAEVEKFVPNCKVLLGDRPINITVQRAIRGLSLTEKILFSLYMLIPRKSGSPLTHEFVEQYKKEEYLTGDLIDDKSTKSEFPSITKSFLTERDMFLAHTLKKSADFQKTSGGILRPVKVVGIIGIGHMKGIMKNWENVDHRQIKEFMKIPPQRFSVQVATFCVKYGLAALVGYGSYSLFNSREEKNIIYFK